MNDQFQFSVSLRLCVAHRIPNTEYLRRRRGTALLEFVLCIPLFALIIALTFFLGWAMMNQQRVKVSARYKVWRDLRSTGEVTSVALNRDFYRGLADNVDLFSDSGVTETLDDLVTEAGLAGQPAEDLAREAVLDCFPHGRRTHVAAEFPSDVPAWQRFEGAIEHRYGLAGVDWRRGEASCRVPVRNQYLDVLDSELRSLPAPADNLGEMIRQLYGNGW